MLTLRPLIPLALIPLLVMLGGCTPKSAAINLGEAGSAIVDQRSFGTQLDDEIIELNAANAIFQNDQLNDQVHFNITSYNFIVLITGEAPTKELKAQIGKIVRSIPKVRRVHNELSVAAPSSILTRTSDVTLTARIKAAMIGDGNDLAHRVKVVTENGNTYLMGLVSRRQGARAVELTQQIGGVQKIYKLFEYID